MLDHLHQLFSNRLAKLDKNPFKSLIIPVISLIRSYSICVHRRTLIDLNDPSIKALIYHEIVSKHLDRIEPLLHLLIAALQRQDHDVLHRRFNLLVVQVISVLVLRGLGKRHFARGYRHGIKGNFT
jgi:hypothetical protein